MTELSRFKEKVFFSTPETFDASALELFQFQSMHNPVYQEYVRALKVNPKGVKSVSDIPFLPISFFKTHEVKTGKWPTAIVFRSSGTTKTGRSTHPIEDEAFYHLVAKESFTYHYGDLYNYQLLALLPSYIEQGDSSLINMVKHFMKFTANGSGFFLNNTDDLLQAIQSPTGKLWLFGVGYALLDLVEFGFPATLFDALVMETGGMKGRRREITRQELHQRLKTGLGPTEIHSEYGMSELLSQAYGKEGSFKFPPWVKVLVREPNDPFQVSESGRGTLNIIDLANIHSCAFVETMDLGMVTERGDFQVLGRMDNSDIRGCSLLI
jgi:hypothetical protein